MSQFDKYHKEENMGKFLKFYKENKITECFDLLKLFGYHVNCDTVNQTDCLNLHLLNKKIIGTYDDNKKPESDDEVVIIIGDYPVSYSSLIHNNPIRRNYKWALNFKYDKFIGNSCWDNVDQFYIINLDEREDRLFDILKECKKAGIPLNKVTKFSAIKYNKTPHYYVNGSIGCSMSHLQVLKDVKANNYNNVIIFEDDFTFSDPIEKTQSNISTFFERNYDYDVALMATSTWKPIEKYDDLLSLSKQLSTTTSGYMISKQGIQKVIKLWEEALELLMTTHSVLDYACDIYWKKIQKDNKMFTFNEKIGYQRPTYSNIANKVTYNLD